MTVLRASPPYGPTLNITFNSGTRNSTEFDRHNRQQFDAFIYIVVVILFYASALVILMVRYMKSERTEARFSYYFDEFVDRERFHQSAQRRYVTRVKSSVIDNNSTDISNEDAYTSSHPLNEEGVNHMTLGDAMTGRERGLDPNGGAVTAPFTA